MIEPTEIEKSRHEDNRDLKCLVHTARLFVKDAFGIMKCKVMLLFLFLRH